jgi:hypothetical protein
MSNAAGVSELRNWRKSGRSIANGDCAEVASSASVVFVRDTKDVSQLTLSYPAASWHSFVTAARAGVFDTFR